MNSFWQFHNYDQHKYHPTHAILEYKQRKVNCTCSKERWRRSNAIWRHGDFSRGSDRWCYRTSTLMETSTHEREWLCECTEGSTHEGSTNKQPCPSPRSPHP